MRIFSSSLILTVFDHDTPLHDGAMVIQGERFSPPDAICR